MTRLHSTIPLNGITAENQTINSDGYGKTARMVLQLEKKISVLQSEIRMEKFKEILRNSPLERNSWKCVMTAFSGILGTVISTSLYTLIPAHNVIENPQYWCEAPLEWLFTFIPLQILWRIYSCSVFTNTTLIQTYRHFCALFIYVALTGSIGFTMIYTILDLPYFQ